MRRPERRNRNIGTDASGFKARNSMRIPESRRDRHGDFRLFHERIETCVTRLVTVSEQDIAFIYQPPLEGFSHGCSTADVFTLLGHVTALRKDCKLPALITFRQPTRKQSQLHPVWGRFAYFAEVGGRAGPAIILEAQEIGRKTTWSRRMTPDAQGEFKRLKSDGHVFEDDDRNYSNVLTEAGLRNTMLYRAVLHELGHYVHYQTDVLNKSLRLDADQNTAEELYFSKPESEREAFAHSFADELSTRMKALENIPFIYQ